jgi:hypothetical protein
MLKMGHFFQLCKIGPVLSKLSYRQVLFWDPLAELYFRNKKSEKISLDETAPYVLSQSYPNPILIVAAAL